MLRPLQQIFPAQKHPQLLVGLEKADDAAVYQLDEQKAIINTTDFFPPVVDDPYDFGAIAAANALSDVYAMGGEVLFAINLVAFPDQLDRDILREILRGGAEKVAEAGAVIAGGHSVSDPEPKYGLAVTGLIDPATVKRKAGAQAGDVLVLTKPLGVGVITTALKRELTNEADVATAVHSMKTLNKQAAQAAQKANAHAMTDITGFGLLGHAFEMVRGTAVDFHFNANQLPLLNGTMHYATAGAFPGGMGRNRTHFYPHVTFDHTVPELLRDILWTPETSGGLLVALAPETVETFLTYCNASIIGHVTKGTGELWIKD